MEAKEELELEKAVAVLKEGLGRAVAVLNAAEAREGNDEEVKQLIADSKAIKGELLLMHSELKRDDNGSFEEPLEDFLNKLDTFIDNVDTLRASIGIEGSLLTGGGATKAISRGLSHAPVTKVEGIVNEVVEKIR